MASTRGLCLIGLFCFADLYLFPGRPLRFALGESIDSSRNRVKRSVTAENGAQLPGGDCSRCSNSHTPYFSGQCFMCPTGTPGPRGPPGQQGIPGRDGRDGRDAPIVSEQQESDGNPGPAGANPDNSFGGAIYVRWGRDVCSNDSVLVYSGIAGGTFYTNRGGGSNYLCMPREPIYDNPTSAKDTGRGYVYGSEYQIFAFPQLNELLNHDVPCAVCMASSRHTLLMVPARNVCPGDEWIKEYSGFLMSEKHDHAGRTEYVCMDRNPQMAPGTAYDTNGVLFQLVEGRCGTHGGGLPCGPYVDGYELTCAVCTI